MLEEIVCLGSRPPNDTPSQHYVMGETDRTLDLRHHLIGGVVGVVLHVEKSGEVPAYGLVFKRENTSVVHIGRRSGQEPDKGRNDLLTSAMFRCAVVSRKHAKIVFSDNGHVRSIHPLSKDPLTYAVRRTSSIQDHTMEHTFVSSVTHVPNCLKRKRPPC